MEELIEKLEELHTLAKEIRASVKDADGMLLRDPQVNWELVTALVMEVTEKSKALGIPTRYNLELCRRNRKKYGRGSVPAH